MRRFERIYPWLLLAPVLLPVVVWSGLIYPYLVPKTFLFYALSFISVGIFAILVVHRHLFYWGRLTRWETWVPGALVVLAYVASYFGMDFYRSFWSLFIRGDGLLMLTCIVASFYQIVLCADRVFFTKLLNSVASIASLVALYGIGEWMLQGGRIGGLLGNAAFFAGYLGIAFFATLVAAQGLSRGWRRIAYFGAVLQLIAIFLSATRGTILALALTGVTYLAYLTFKEKGKCRIWSASALVALALLGGLFFSFRAQLAQSSFTPIARIASVSTSDTDVASRLFIWKHMVAEIGQRPWLGVGAEHIDALFNQFYDPTQIYEQWFDRSHNAFLDYAVQYGIGGLLLYLALIGSFVTIALQRRKEKSSILFILLALAYAVQNFFVFDTVSSLWLLVALLGGWIAVSAEGAPSKKEVPSWAPYAAWGGAALLVLLIVPVSIRPLTAAYNLAEAYRYQFTDVKKEGSYLSHGIALGTYADVEYGYQVYDIYTNNQTGFLTGQERVDAYQAAVSILTINFNRYPYDARTALYLTQVLTLAPQGVTIDQTLLSAALERAIRLSPKRYQPWYILVNLSLGRANAYPAGSDDRTAGYRAARDLLMKYIDRVPTLSQPYFVLAQLDYALGDTKLAAADAEKGKSYYTQDLETAKRAAGYYETVFDLKNATYFLAEVVRIEPGNTAAADDLKKIQDYEQSTR